MEPLNARGGLASVTDRLLMARDKINCTSVDKKVPKGELERHHLPGAPDALSRTMHLQCEALSALTACVDCHLQDLICSSCSASLVEASSEVTILAIIASEFRVLVSGLHGDAERLVLATNWVNVTSC